MEGGDGNTKKILIKGIPVDVVEFYLILYTESVTEQEVVAVDRNTAAGEAVVTLDKPLADLEAVQRRCVQKPLNGRVVNVLKFQPPHPNRWETQPVREPQPVKDSPNEGDGQSMADYFSQTNEPGYMSCPPGNVSSSFQQPLTMPPGLQAVSLPPSAQGPLQPAWVVGGNPDVGVSVQPHNAGPLSAYPPETSPIGCQPPQPVDVIQSRHPTVQQPNAYQDWHQKAQQVNTFSGWQQTQQPTTPAQQNPGFQRRPPPAHMRGLPRELQPIGPPDFDLEKETVPSFQMPSPTSDTFDSEPVFQKPVRQTVTTIEQNPEKIWLVRQRLPKFEKCQVKYDSSAGQIHVEGEKGAVTDAKVRIYEQLSSLRETRVDISVALAEKLQKEKGRRFLKDKSVCCVVCMSEDGPSLLVFATEEDETVQHFRSLFSKQQVTLNETHTTFIKSKEWDQLKESLQRDRLLVVTTQKDGLCVEGGCADVERALSTVQPKLSENATLKTAIDVKKGIVRYLESHKSDVISDIKKRGVWVKLPRQSDSRLQIELRGQVDKVKAAKEILTKQTRTIAYEKEELTKAGQKALLSCDMGKNIIKMMENKHRCVIEVRGTRPASDKKPSEAKPPSPEHSKSSHHSSGSHDGVLFSRGSVKLELRKGDLSNYKADVLVNTISGKGSDLDQGGIVSKMFLQQGGYELQQQYEERCGKWKDNMPVPTEAHGNLQARFVYHLRLPNWRDEQTEELLERMLMSCLKMASDKGCRTIAFPTVGCGGLRYPPGKVRKAFTNACGRAASDKVTLTVFLVAYDDGMYQQMLQSPSGAQGHSKQAEHAESKHSRPKVKVTLHVNASDAPTAKSAVKDLKKNMNDFLPEKLIKNSAIKEMTGKQIGEFHRRCLDSVDMEIDTHSGVIKLYGLPREVGDMESVVEKMIKDIPSGEYAHLSAGQRNLIEMAEDSFKLPEYWTNTGKMTSLKGQFMGMLGISQKSTRVALSKSTVDSVRALVTRSWRSDVVGHGQDAVNLRHSKLRVKSVERIQNPQMWYEYCCTRKKLLLRAGWEGIPLIKNTQKQKPVLTTTLNVDEFNKMVVPEINEVFLFHGTPVDKVGAVVNQGLDSRLADQGGMFGKGIYFTESSTKADQYADPKASRHAGDHYMLLARVLMGHAFVATSPQDFRRPPCLQCRQDVCSHDRHYDSVIGTHRGMQGAAGKYVMMGGSSAYSASSNPLLFREFVVFEKAHSYPEYLIQYERE